MPMHTLEELIGAAPVFAGLPQEHLALIAGCAVNDRFAPGTLLFEEGGAADRFFLVRSGTVSLEIHAPGGGPLVIETLHEGDVVGWSWLFEPYRWHFDARALSDVRATAFDGACLRGKCEQDPALGYALMSCFAQVMIERLQWTQLRLVDVYGNGNSR